MTDESEGTGGSGDRRDADDGGREDPFEDLSEYADRDGDPFDHLDGRGDPGGESAPRDSHDDADTGSGPSPGHGAGAGEPTDERATADPGDPDPGEQDPFEYVADADERGGPTLPDDARERSDEAGGSGRPREAGGGPDQSGGPSEVDVRAGDPFGDVEVSEEDPFGSGTGTFDDAGVEGVDPDEVWDRLTGEGQSDPVADPAEDDDDVAAVSKHDFCETCEFFSAPPAVECTHEGTDILEFVDIETVRVANCPVVAERRELGGLEE